MSQDFEKFVRSQPLKEPSEKLDDRIFSLLDSSDKSLDVKPFPWQKVLTYAVAAMLFLSIGVTELVRRIEADTSETNLSQTPISESAVTVPTVRVSTSDDNVDNINGRKARPLK